MGFFEKLSLGVGMFAILGFLGLIWFISYQSETITNYKFGQTVNVTQGFYEGCTGVVVGKYDGQNKYQIDATCGSEGNTTYFLKLDVFGNQMTPVEKGDNK